MKKKNRKLKDFIRSTKCINYNNLEQIVETFNMSMNSYMRFKDVLSGGDEELASRKLREASNKLYNVCEWIFKKCLYNTYTSLKERNIISSNECDIFCRKLNSHQCTLKYLIDEINKFVEPKPEEKEIDFEIIKRYAYIVNNAPKHSGHVPDPEKYILSAMEIRKFINVYINERVELNCNTPLIDMEDTWYEIKEECDEFDDINSYILIVGPMTGMKKELLKNLFDIHWDIIFDFDIYSDENGLAHLYKEITLVNPMIRDLKKTNAIKPINYISTPYWVMAGGYADDEESISNDNNWRIKYGRNFPDFIDKFHSIYTKPAKVFVCYYNHDKIVNKMVEDFNVAYNNGEDIDFIALSNNIDFENILEENFKKYPLTLEALLNNLKMEFELKSKGYSKNVIAIPAKDETINLESDYFTRLQDSFEVVYIGIENNEIDDQIKNNPENFYKGICELSWIGAKKHFDVRRAKLKSVEEKIRTDLNERGRIIKALKYNPGVGGTTFMRRLAWEIHNEFPVLILKNYIQGQTEKNVEKLFNISKMPILILIDSNDVSAIDARKLYTELKADSFPFVIYFIERVNGIESKTGIITSYEYLRPLKDIEITDMKEVLIPHIVEEECKFKVSNISELDEQPPFIISMYAFDKEFKGIKPYIRNFLKEANSEFKKILSYIALADYANEPIDIQFFVELFENEDISEFIFKENSAFGNLVIITERLSNKKYFKIKYHLFAEEILIQLSSGEYGKRIKFSTLLEYIISFIEDSRKNPYLYNHDTIELLRILFITRVEDEDSTKPAFSPLIEQLKQEYKSEGVNDSEVNDIIARIFKKLVEIYPEEPHFLAHLARYYFYIEGNYEKGLEKIDEAISISNAISSYERKDPLLYHMKAMGYSSRITNKYIKEARYSHKNGEIDEVNDKIELIKDDARRALELFKEVRVMGHGVAGYISDINLCVHIAEFGKFVSENTDFKEFAKDIKNAWYVKLIDNAYTLFEECKKISDEKDNITMIEIEKDLKQLVGEIENSIEDLEKYLKVATPDQKPIIRRMLSRAYQTKNNNPINVNQTEIKRIVELMENNIYDEPERTGNIRIWFNAIRKLKTNNPESVLDDAIVKLNTWLILTEEIDAYFYRFILKFIKAVDGSTAAQKELPKLLRELKSKAEHLPNKTTIHEWFGKEGDGIEKLLNAREHRINNSEDDLTDKLHILKGRISDYYVNDNHAYISLFGIDVFFNPSITGGEIDVSKIKQKVTFGLGFSYDGPRALNNSINSNIDSANDSISSNVIGNLENGSIVKCEVYKNVEHFVKVKILGFGYDGSIHLDNLNNGYSKDNRPKTGCVLDAQILNKSFDSRTNKEIWNLTMKINDDLKDFSELTDFQRRLLEIADNIKLEKE